MSEQRIIPTPRTPLEMERETMRTIRGVCEDIMRAVDNDDYHGVMVQCVFLKTQVNRLEMLHRNVRPSAREMR